MAVSSLNLNENYFLINNEYEKIEKTQLKKLS